MLHRLVERQRLNHEDLDLRNEEIRVDHDVRRAVDHDLAGLLHAVGGFHALRVLGQAVGCGVEPAHRHIALAELRPQVVLGMPLAEVA
ncbi:hypothetical protein D3C85_1421370 [compost metagenome]